MTNPLNTSTSQHWHLVGRRTDTSQSVLFNIVQASYEANAPLHYYALIANTPASLTNGRGMLRRVDARVQSASGSIVLDSGVYYIPPVVESPVYDADGNLIQDGRWDYNGTRKTA